MSPPGKHLHIHVTVRQEPWIGELVLAVNTPEEILAAPHSCGGRDWIVGLQFYPRTGKSVAVTLQCGDLQVGRYPELIDPGNQALLTVQKIILVACQTKACKEIAQWPS